MIYDPTAVASVMNIWCFVARLLPGTLTTWYPQYITSYLLLVLCIYMIKCYCRMMYRYTWRTLAQKRGLNNLLPKWYKWLMTEYTNWMVKIISSTGRRKYWYKQIKKNSSSTRSCGKQWTYYALNISNYLYGNMIISTIPDVPYWKSLRLLKMYDTWYIYTFYKFYNYIHGKYICNRSVMLTNNACFMKRNIVVLKHMTRKESLRNNEKHCGFDTLRLVQKMDFV